jgi:homoserine kinase
MSLGGVESPIQVTVVLPHYYLSTREARAALPEQIPMHDAVYNISHAVMVAEAFRNADLALLGRAMTDSLHQQHRLKLIPGAQAAMEAARQAGAAAVALSGAGPSLIAFSAERDPSIGEAMQRAFEEAGLESRVLPLRMSNHGAEVHI